MIAPVAGGPVRKLTSDGHSLYPLWGPTQIAYVRYSRPTGRHRHEDGPKYNLWLIKPDGSGRRQLTHDRVPFLLTGLTPTDWSADGTRLLTQFGGQDTTYAVTVNPVSGRERIVGKASQGIVGTSLSLDGSTILGYTGGAFEDQNKENTITVPYTGRQADRAREARLLPGLEPLGQSLYCAARPSSSEATWLSASAVLCDSLIVSTRSCVASPVERMPGRDLVHAGVLLLHRRRDLLRPTEPPGRSPRRAGR